MRGAQLGLVEQESGLGSGVLFYSKVLAGLCLSGRCERARMGWLELTKGHGGRLGLALILDLEAGYLAAVYDCE